MKGEVIHILAIKLAFVLMLEWDELTESRRGTLY